MTIEEYLAELRRHLRGSPLAKRRILREVETHLSEAAKRDGVQSAIASFGLPEEIARRFDRRRVPWRLGAVVVAVVLLAGTAAVLFVTVGGSKRPTRHAAPAYRLVTTGFTESGSTDGSASARVTMVVLDRNGNTVVHVTCSSNTRTGLRSVREMAASVDPRTIMGIPSPNCARTS
jgi:hypothetical protein